MKNQKFGIEIEFTGMTRYEAAKTVAAYFGTTEEYVGGGYDAYQVTDATGRHWKVMSDSSIREQARRGETATSKHRCELVSPICEYGDIETIQELVRQLRHNGMKVNSSTGIHVHIDASTHTAQSLKNIANIMASKEDLLFMALDTEQSRIERWCRKVDTRFLERINTRGQKTMTQLRSIWYNGHDGAHNHYDSSRYHALNLHSVWQKGTVEFRCFNSTTHAGKIKAYIQLCLAISNQAKTQKSASRKTTVTDNPKFTFRTWLIHLGLNGEEFKTARTHLLANLDGNSAFRNGRGVA